MECRVFFFVLLGCVGWTSCCEPSPSFELIREQFVYSNHSSYPVHIEYHRSDSVYHLSIASNGSIIQRGYAWGLYLDHILQSDSVVLTFGQSKQLIYTQSSLPPPGYQSQDGNILDCQQYSLLPLGERHRQYTYQITSAHVDRATPLD